MDRRLASVDRTLMNIDENLTQLVAILRDRSAGDDWKKSYLTPCSTRAKRNAL